MMTQMMIPGSYLFVEEAPRMFTTSASGIMDFKRTLDEEKSTLSAACAPKVTLNILTATILFNEILPDPRYPAAVNKNTSLWWKFPSFACLKPNFVSMPQLRFKVRELILIKPSKTLCETTVLVQSSRQYLHALSTNSIPLALPTSRTC
jgi:hypothetical protein